MANTKLTQEEIQSLIEENDRLKRENKYLKRLTSSKRFHFAVRVGDAYNQVFPVDSRRRKIASSIGASYRAFHTRHIEKVTARATKKLAALTTGHDQVIVLNSIPYDTKLKQRPHHLAKEFAKLGFFVIYLEPDNPVNRLRQINDHLVTINSYRYLADIKNTHKFFLTPNNMPTELEELEAVKDWGFGLIYDYLDEFHEDISGDLSIQLRVWEHLSDLDPVLCIATAKRLKKHISDHLHNSCPVVMASNAVNLDHFNYQKQDASVPDDLKKVLKLKQPIVGFYGALAPWIDFGLINTVADHHPEWSLVLIGINYNEALSDLKPAQNIHYLGSKDYSDLAKYSKHFDCAIIPFRQGEIAKATSPVKLFEYMATGLPTVCTRDLEECKGYDYVYMSKNTADFERDLAQAIKDKKSAKVRARLLEQAAENTWAKRAATIAEALSRRES